MTLSRQQLIGGLAALVLVGLIVYFAALQFNDAYKYRGLITTNDVQMTPGMKVLLENRIAVTQAAIPAWGDEVDLDMYLSIANDAWLLGDLVTAREAAQKAVDGNPANYASWAILGTVSKEMEDYDEARVAYKKSIEASPGVEEYYRDYVELLYDQWPEEREEIKATLELAISDTGRTSWNMTTLGTWYAQAGDCDRAEDHYDIALDLEPGNQAIKDSLEQLEDSCIETP